MGHPVLRRKARALDKGDIRSPEVQRLIDDMIDTMNEYHGVGLAAPQVHEDVRLFVAFVDEDPKADPIAIINPEISPVGDEMELGWEGCLSIPDIRGRVPRYRRVVVKAYDREARRIEITATGFPARVVQHETDHLDGILFFDRMKSLESLTFLEEYSRYWAQDEEEEDDSTEP